MKKIMKSVVLPVMSIVLITTMLSFVVEQNKDWVVPAKDKAMKNANPDAAAGKALWALHCKSCHGKDGLGDGTKAGDLKTNAGDFSSAAFQAQTDGDIYYKTSVGKGEMPAYDKKLPSTDDRWALVSFMRTMKK